MPGGPINGSGLYGETVLKETPAAAIIIPTMLQIAADMVDGFRNVTCLYDRFWYNRPDIVTLPICFFYIKNISETTQIETSKQRILLYEPQISAAESVVAKLSDPIRKGVQEVVVDNSVIQPRKYQIEAILPFQPMSKQFNRSFKEANQIIDAMVTIFAGVPNSFSMFTGLADGLETVGSLIDAASLFSDSDSSKHINKNSLDAMAAGQKVLTMKMWYGYDYKYVQIIGLDIKKDGKEDDVFRATIHVEERPVLTMTAASDAKKSTVDRNWASNAVNGARKVYATLAAETTGVRAASGAALGE